MEATTSLDSGASFGPSDICGAQGGQPQPSEGGVLAEPLPSGGEMYLKALPPQKNVKPAILSNGPPITPHGPGWGAKRPSSRHPQRAPAKDPPLRGETPPRSGPATASPGSGLSERWGRRSSGDPGGGRPWPRSPTPLLPPPLRNRPQQPAAASRPSAGPSQAGHRKGASALSLAGSPEPSPAASLRGARRPRRLPSDVSAASHRAGVAGRARSAEMPRPGSARPPPRLPDRSFFPAAFRHSTPPAAPDPRLAARPPAELPA